MCYSINYIFMYKRTKIILSFIVLIICYTTTAQAQSYNGISSISYAVENGDTIMCITLKGVLCHHFKKKSDARLYERLVRAVKLTYPIALEAEKRLKTMEDHILTISSKKEQDKYIKSVETQLKEEYTPVLKRMSMYQGMVLLKLIDRQTGKTSYTLVQELRGKFSAVFWQGITRLFGGNLKTEYDKEGEDAMIEYIIYLYEHGLI